MSNNLEHMVEQHVREYESRLKHVDELVERAKATGHPEVHQALDQILEQRSAMAAELDSMRLKSLDDWRAEEIAKSGPMGVWDALAQQLEELVERFER
jgi:ferritin-like metal-binding protein YciE